MMKTCLERHAGAAKIAMKRQQEAIKNLEETANHRGFRLVASILKDVCDVICVHATNAATMDQTIVSIGLDCIIIYYFDNVM